LKTFTADADPVADGTPVRLHDVEKPLGGLNNDRPGSLGGAVKNDLAPKLRRQLLVGGIGNDARFIADRHVHALRESVRHRHRKEHQQDDLDTEREAKQQHRESQVETESCQPHKI